MSMSATIAYGRLIRVIVQDRVRLEPPSEEDRNRLRWNHNARRWDIVKTDPRFNVCQTTSGGFVWAMRLRRFRDR